MAIYISPRARTEREYPLSHWLSRWLALGMVLALWPPPAKGTPGPQLPASVEALFQHNQAIQAAGQTMLAARQRVAASGLLPAPAVEATGFVRPIQTRDGPMESQIMLGQHFPLWGQPHRQRRVAALRANSGAQQLLKVKTAAVYWVPFRHGAACRCVMLLSRIGGLTVHQPNALPWPDSLSSKLSLAVSPLGAMGSGVESRTGRIRTLHDPVKMTDSSNPEVQIALSGARYNCRILGGGIIDKCRLPI